MIHYLQAPCVFIYFYIVTVFGKKRFHIWEKQWGTHVVR